MSERTVERSGMGLAVEEAGDGVPVVLLHGLTATRRYVVMGSKLLERSGHHKVAYDARGHGQSDPAPAGEGYGYVNQAGDLGHVMDALGIERAVLAGVSMGSHTVLRFALDNPERVTGLVVITPGYDPESWGDPDRLARLDALAGALRDGDIDDVVAAYGEPQVPGKYFDTVRAALAQRMSAHLHPEAVADALQELPRAQPFGEFDDLAAIDVPTVVVASRDEIDVDHPFALAERYTAAIPGARIVSEEPGAPPLAWQGGRVSRVIAEIAAEATPAR